MLIAATEAGGGEGGIRTLVTVTCKNAFQACRLNTMCRISKEIKHNNIDTECVSESRLSQYKFD